MGHDNGRIAELRALRGWSQGELARRSGVSRETISRLERGTVAPRLQSLVALAGALDVDPIELTRGRQFT